MPVYELTSPKTGRVYNVDATAELPDDDIDALVNDLDFEAAREAGVQPGVDPAVLQQGPVGSFLQSIPQTFSKVGSGMIGGSGRILDKASESLSQATGLPKGGDMFQRMADYGDELSTSADLTFPTNPLNPVAGTIGSGAAQGLSLLAGGLAGKALTGSNVAMTAVPAASGFLSGANEGIQTAEQIGVQSPLAQLGTGMAFGGLEVLTERLGGIGSKAGTEALTRAVRQTAGQMLRSSGRAVGSEALEEVLAGRSQAALTRLIASEDPDNPGFTRTGVNLDALASQIVNLEAMKLEALGGAAGGTVFAGVQALANRQLPNDPTTSANQTPSPTQPPAPGQPGAPAPMAPGAPGAAAVSPLIGIAQRGGAVDVTLPEDTGELTAEEVQDLETGRLGDLETGRRQPILQDVPDQVPGSRFQVSGSQTLPPAANPDPAQTITGSNVQTGTEMPVPPPTAEAGAGAGAVGNGQPPTASVTKDSGPTADQTVQVSDPGAGSSPAAGASPSTTETSGISLLRQLNAELPPEAQARWTPEVYAKSERYMQTGNEADLEGLTPIQRRRVINARIDADPDLRKAQEQWDRKMEHKASSIDKRDRAFEQKTTFKPKASEQSRDDAPGFRHLVIDRDLEAGFMSGAGADALIDLAHRAFAAGRTFAQWAAAMVQRFGAAVRDYLAGVWDHAKRSSQTGALNFTSRLGEQLQQSQQAASRLRNPASRATPAAMASDPGAAQNAEPSPGGLSEAGASPERMIELLIERVEAIRETVEDEGLELGLRGLQDRNNNPVDANIGDVLPESFEWDDGDPTDNSLGGTAVFKLGSNTEKAIRTAVAYFNGGSLKLGPSFKNGRYQDVIFAIVGGIDRGNNGMPERFASVFEDATVFDVLRFPKENPTVSSEASMSKSSFQSDNRTGSAAEYMASNWSEKTNQQVPKTDRQETNKPFVTEVNPESSRAAAGTSPRLPVSPSPRLEPPATAAPLKAAYASALRGSSTAMVPLADVFAAAQAANPALTQEQFQAQVMADYEAGSLMLEGAGSPQEAQNAGLRIDGTPVGTAVRMMVPQGFTHLDVSGRASQRGAVQIDSRTVRQAPNETRSRFASPNPADRVIDGPRTDELVTAEANAWLGSMDQQAAIEAFVAGQVPLSLDTAERAAATLIANLSEQAATAKTEMARMWAHVQGRRMARVWTTEHLSADPARALRQRGVVNNTILAPIAPVLAAQELLEDRAKKVIDQRFDGGTEGAVEKVKDIATKADEQAGTDLAGQIEGTPPAPELGDNPETGGQARPNTKPRDKTKETPKQRQAREKVNKAQRTAQSILDELSRRYADPPIFAEGQRRVDLMRELYKERVKTGMSEAEFVRRAMELGANEGTAGILWEASKLEIEAREIMEREKLREPLSKLLESNSPALAKLLNVLRKKMFPGMNWADIFTQLPESQKERQREIYRRLMLDKRLKALNQGERLQLTNELDKAWQRERRKVFMRELEKADVLGEAKPKDREKVKAAAPRLLRLMNLGMLNSEMFREALAKEYGLNMIDAAAAADLRALGERIQKAPEGLPRRKLEQQLVERLQKLTGYTLWQVMDSWWTASVLSGWRTQVDIGLSIANGIEDIGLGSIVAALRSGNKDVAVRGLAALFGRIPSAFMEAVNHIATGNKAMMRNFELEVKQAMEGGNQLASDVGRQMWDKGGWRKVPGGFMVFYGRLMTALDHVNSASTREGAKALALARHPELYEKALRISAADRAAARQQARLEMTGGAPPATQQERIEENARMREILEQGIPAEMLAEATEVGRAAALQGEPTGLGGTLLDAVLSTVSVVNRKAQELAKRENPDRVSRAGAVVTAAMVPFVRAITGTKFARTVAHALNRTTSYVPGIGIITVGQQGRTGAFGDILAARQVIGTLVGIALYLAFDDDEDEKGIEDSWEDKTPQQKAQLYAQGKQPFTIWERDSQGRVRSWNYQQWGIAGIVNTVAQMHKQKGSEAGTLNVLMSSITQGAMSFTDKAQLQGLQTVLGAEYRSTDPAKGLAANLNKYAAQTVGGMVPRLVKDIDMVASPELRNTSEWWQKWAKEVPMLRQLSSGKRIDILGQDITLDRGPLSRVTQLGTADPIYRMLGNLNARDVWLPDPSQGVRVVKLRDGTRRNMTSTEKDRYQRLTGAAYRAYLEKEGPALMQMSPEDAQEAVSKATARLRSTAAYQATH